MNDQEMPPYCLAASLEAILTRGRGQLVPIRAESEKF